MFKSRTGRLAGAGIAALVMAVVTGVAGIASGVLFQSPGQYRLNQTSTFAEIGDWGPGGPPPVLAGIDVEQGTFIAHFTGDSPSLVDLTVVQVSYFSTVDFTSWQACFSVPASDFAAAGDVSGATLDTTLTQSEVITDGLLPVPGIGGGGKGGGTCFAFGNPPLPLHLHVDWTAGGPVASTHKSGRYTCGGYAATFNSSMSSVEAAASATFSNLPGVETAGFAAVNAQTVDEVVQGSGVLPSSCFGTGLQ